ncbi:MAG: hypothetical protein N2647_05960, partial [Thermodesulfovibrio sp.]|nr:hypothetical protein [Thermodesulfovibrio sp.]
MFLKTLLFSLILLIIMPVSSFSNELADLIIVMKSKRIMFLMNEGKILKAYKIALGKSPVGKKTIQGDGKT